MTADELADALGVQERERKALRALLATLEEEGAVVRTRSQRYAAPERLDLIVGTLQGNARGFGWVLPDNPEFSDLYISADSLAGAMDRDRVIARIQRRRDNRSPEGEIIRILRRARKTLVGRIDRDGQATFVKPDDKRIPYDILVARGETKGIHDGDKVVVELTRYPDGRRGPEGRVTERIGRSGEPGVDITSVIRKYELPEQFPKPVLDEAEAVPETVSAEEIERRADLRPLRIVTIDGADAKDLDDAVSLEKNEDGWRLGVHIADVSYYVREGAALDNEARTRGTSVYLLDRVVPMLPPRLSNGICSLNPNIERLTMSVFMNISRDGRVLGYDIMRSVIKTYRRMTYAEVNDILAGNPAPGLRDLTPWFREMQELAELLSERRRQRGSIDFDFAEEKIILDHSGWPVEVEKVVRGPAERIIEEFMIVANETVAQRFHTLEVPFIYRVHEKPAPDRLEALNEFLGHFGLHLKSVADLKPKALQAILKRVAGRPEEHLINTVVLRSMRQATYFAENLGHFGLASECYTHFTSPIRRYPDLQIHRIIGELLESGRYTEKRFEKLEKLVPLVARESSERERVAQEAEREVADLKKVEFMSEQVGEIFDGIIAGVTSFGLFVELPNGIQGLVHVSNLTDDYYHYDEKAYALIGERRGRRFRIGDQMTVLVAHINVDDRTIDFLPQDSRELVAGEALGHRDRRAVEQAARAVARAQRDAAANPQPPAKPEGRRRGKGTRAATAETPAAKATTAKTAAATQPAQPAPAAPAVQPTAKAPAKVPAKTDPDTDAAATTATADANAPAAANGTRRRRGGRRRKPASGAAASGTVTNGTVTNGTATNGTATNGAKANGGPASADQSAARKAATPVSEPAAASPETQVNESGEGAPSAARRRRRRR